MGRGRLAAAPRESYPCFESSLRLYRDCQVLDGIDKQGDTPGARMVFASGWGFAVGGWAEGRRISEDTRAGGLEDMR